MSGPDITPAAETSIAAVDAQPAPTAPVATAGSGDVLAQNTTERLIIVWGATITFCLSIVGIVGSLCYRVIVDGNSTLTNDITTKLAFVAAGAIVMLTASLLGQTQLLGKFLDKLP